MKLKTKYLILDNLATTTTLTGVENKVPDNSKYVTTPKCNKLTAEDFAARLAQGDLASKNNNANFDDELIN